MTDERITPNGAQVKITTDKQILLIFDNPRIPTIVFDPEGANNIGSCLSSASHRAKTGHDME